MVDKNLTLSLDFVNKLLDTLNILKNTLNEYKEYVDLVNKSGINVEKSINNPCSIISLMKGDAYLIGLEHLIDHTIPDCMQPFIDYSSKNE